MHALMHYAVNSCIDAVETMGGASIETGDKSSTVAWPGDENIFFCLRNDFIFLRHWMKPVLIRHLIALVYIYETECSDTVYA